MAAPFGPPPVFEEAFLARGRDASQAARGDLGDQDVAVRQFERPFGKLEAGSDNAEIHGEHLRGSGRILPEAAALFASAAECRACPGMGCRPVLATANGPVPARVMFIGEAPGRLGAGRTGVPFSGDVAGRRFELLLAAADLTRAAVFISNAVLCLPLDAHARNRPPTRAELANCAPRLAQTIDVVAPQVVVAMGRVALEALRQFAPHDLQLSHAGRRPVVWGSRQLAVVYHPGARSQVHRSWDDQLADWRRLGEWLVESRHERRTLRP